MDSWILKGVQRHIPCIQFYEFYGIDDLYICSLMTFILYFPFQICVIHPPRVKGFDRSAGRVLSCLIIESNDRISTT
jgi:hypothetical protein